MRAADAALVVVDGVARRGSTKTEKVWGLRMNSICRAHPDNKLDRERSDSSARLQASRKNLGAGGSHPVAYRLREGFQGRGGSGAHEGLYYADGWRRERQGRRDSVGLGRCRAKKPMKALIKWWRGNDALMEEFFEKARSRGGISRLALNRRFASAGSTRACAAQDFAISAAISLLNFMVENFRRQLCTSRFPAS